MILEERLPFLLPAAPLVALLAFAPLLYFEPLWVVLAVPVLAALALMTWNPTLSIPALLAAVMVSDGLVLDVDIGVILSMGKLTVLGVLVLMVSAVFASPFVPGPGALTAVAGIAILAREYEWARDVHVWAARQADRFVTWMRGLGRRRRDRTRPATGDAGEGRGGSDRSGRTH